MLVLWIVFIFSDAADEQEVSCNNEDRLTEALTDEEPFSSPKTSAFILLGRSIMRQSYVIALIIMMVTFLSCVYSMCFCTYGYVFFVEVYKLFIYLFIFRNFSNF